ncbi:hypothetical protein BES34_020100 [Leptospira inadai serovar Lyme]|nr:hypothetical protein BES34_020100 [Leptospira inadai serovar Lyme]
MRINPTDLLRSAAKIQTKKGRTIETLGFYDLPLKEFKIDRGLIKRQVQVAFICHFLPILSFL